MLAPVAARFAPRLARLRPTVPGRNIVIRREHKPVFNSRLHHRWLTGWLILMLLFMQAATASYACPQAGASPGAAMEMPGCEDTAPGAGMDPEQPLLCMASCLQGASTASSHVTLDAPFLAVLYVVASAVPLQLQASAPVIAFGRLGESPPGWPPLYLFNRILRN